MAKILLVEDDKSLREIYGVRLMAEGYTIISAGDGEEALAVAIKERPDLIVSDVMMPKISGFDMLDILRSTTETKDIKVIMMTALSSEDQRARGEALGADRYLVKSQVGIEDVVRTVHDVLADGITAAPVAAVVTEQPAAPPEVAIEPIQPVTAPAPVTPQQPPVEIAAPAEPQPVDEPAPAPIQTPVEAPIETPAVVAQPAPEPFVPEPQTPPAPAPVDPAPAPVTFPPSSTLPEPTAPFSSNPPASLGDRIINPLPSATDLGGNGVVDIAAQMNQELNTHLQSTEQPAEQQQSPVPPIPPQPGV